MSFKGKDLFYRIASRIEQSHLGKNTLGRFHQTIFAKQKDASAHLYSFKNSTPHFDKIVQIIMLDMWAKICVLFAKLVAKCCAPKKASHLVQKHFGFQI